MIRKNPKDRPSDRLVFRHQQANERAQQYDAAQADQDDRPGAYINDVKYAG
jgi:hypothetical protein